MTNNVNDTHDLDIPASFLDSLDDNIVVLNREGTIVATNAARRNPGRSGERVDLSGRVGSSYFSAAREILNGNVERVMQATREVLRGRRSDFSAGIPCSSTNEKQWFEIRVKRFTYRSEPYVTVTHADVTELKQQRQNLTDRNKRQELAQHMADLGHWTVLFPERVVKCSDEVFRIFGLDPAQPDPGLEETFRRYHEEDREIVRQKFQQALETGEAVDFSARIRRPDGEIRHVRGCGQPRYDESGTLEDIFGVLQDVTDQKRVENALRENEQRFRQLAENITEVFWVRDVRRNEVLYVSPAYESVWGRSVESLYENPQGFLEAVHPEDRDRIERQLPHGPTGKDDLEYRIRKPDGEIRWIRDRAYPIRDEAGDVYRIAGIAEDITEQKEAQQQLRNLLLEKETLLQEVHHRVKNSLQVILGLLGLQSRKLDNPQAVEALQNSQRRIQSMAMIHQKLYETATLSEVDFADYADELVQKITESHIGPEGAVDVQVDVQPSRLDTDTTIACGLIVNELVTNALKHAFPDGETGTITVEFSTDGSGDHHLVVSDDGGGIDLENLKQRESLGLNLVHNLAVNQLQGDVHYTRDDGLTVEVVFPPASARHD